MAAKSRFVVAIDFGTAYSGFAFRASKGEKNVHVHVNWKGVEGSHYKTSTSVLLDENQELVEFGDRARTVFSEFEPHEAEKYYFFEKFKMELMREWKEDKENKLRADTMLTAHGGKKKMKAMSIIAISLKFLKDTFESEIEKSLALTLEPEDVQWVVTVPAIWNDSAKSFMRQAANEAGLSSTARPEGVIIALEPEAAGLCCKELTVESLNADGSTGANQKEFRKMAPGDKYIIIDAGGGTVDIAVHELQPNDNVKELHAPSGGDWGGEKVNAAYEEMFANILGKECIERVKREDLPYYLDFIRLFEVAKTNWDNDTNKNISIAASEGGFLTTYIEMNYRGEKKRTKDAMEEACKKFNSKFGLDVEYSRGRFRFGPKASLKLFAPAIDPMMEHIKKLLQKVRGVSRAFLVGGFSESRYLQDRVKLLVTQLPGRTVQVLVPSSPGKAVMIGAVKYAENPSIITSRVAKLTYGFGMVAPYNRDKHDISRRVKDDDGEYCVHDCFDKVVEIGEDVPIDEANPRVRTFGFHNHANWGADSMAQVPVYCTDQKDAVYTDELTLLGSVQFQVPEAGEEGCVVSLNFSMTEIEVSAVDKKSGKQGKAAIDYLGH